ncbi:hypothetical protein AWB68_03170 [Caballeronia choica]|uniref:Secreted protein n=1 Tax=Caballeronia choica TaxID=326476 RepID=A0A158IXG0_9BURK|nr:hypothetical protein AWB68_03170 [Caballeronia choica]
MMRRPLWLRWPAAFAFWSRSRCMTASAMHGASSWLVPLHAHNARLAIMIGRPPADSTTSS